MNVSKDYGRLHSMLGTWTVRKEVPHRPGQSRTDHLATYIVVHIQTDPTRGYGCALDGCLERDNAVCYQPTDGDVVAPSCRRLDQANGTTVWNWSDLAVFYTVGVEGYVADANRSIVRRDLHGWVGPYSVVAASVKEASTTLMDAYELRYVPTAVSQLVAQPHPNATLYRNANDFRYVWGTHALAHTVRTQANRTLRTGDPWGNDVAEDDDNNSTKRPVLQPILPHMQFTFAKGNYGNERITVKMDAQVVLLPNDDGDTPDVWDSWARTFALGGPYQYQESVTNSYAISLHDPTHAGERFDSSPVVIRGCVDDLPCTPPAAQGGLRERTFVTNDAYGFDVENIVLVFLTYVLTLALVISLVYNIQSWRRSTGESTGAATHNEHAEDRRNPARPVEAATVQDALQEPLLAVPSTDETV